MRLKTYKHIHLAYSEGLQFGQSRLSALGRYESTANWPYLSLNLTYVY